MASVSQFQNRLAERIPEAKLAEYDRTVWQISKQIKAKPGAPQSTIDKYGLPAGVAGQLPE